MLAAFPDVGTGPKQTPPRPFAQRGGRLSLLDLHLIYTVQLKHIERSFSRQQGLRSISQQLRPSLNPRQVIYRLAGQPRTRTHRFAILLTFFAPRPIRRCSRRIASPEPSESIRYAAKRRCLCARLSRYMAASARASSDLASSASAGYEAAPTLAPKPGISATRAPA